MKGEGSTTQEGKSASLTLKFNYILFNFVFFLNCVCHFLQRKAMASPSNGGGGRQHHPKGVGIATRLKRREGVEEDSTPLHSTVLYLSSSPLHLFTFSPLYQFTSLPFPLSFTSLHSTPQYRQYSTLSTVQYITVE